MMRARAGGARCAVLRSGIGPVWLIGLLLMSCASAVFAEGCRLEQVGAVDLSVSPEGHVLIPVEIGGVRVRMGIDVGSGLSEIYSGAVAALNLEQGSGIPSGRLNAGGVPLTQTVVVRGLTIGNSHWKPTQILVRPWNKNFPQSLSDDDVVGVLGQDVFSSLDLELDFGAHQLRLYTQKHCPGKVVYWARQYDMLPLQKGRLGNLSVAMAVNGRPVATTLSTMSPISTMEEEAAKGMLGVDRVSGTGDAGGSADGCSHCRSILLQAQGLEIRNARVQIVSRVSKNCWLSMPRNAGGLVSYDCIGAFPLRLGVNVLSNLHLYFANGEKKLYFTEAGANSLNASTRPAVSTPAAAAAQGQ